MIAELEKQNTIEVHEVIEQNPDLNTKEGISGQVTMTTNVTLEYPNIRLIANGKNPQKYKIAILKSMLLGTDTKLFNDSDTTLMVYIQPIGCRLQECGKIYQSQVRALLKLFQDDMQIEVDMNNGKTLTGVYVFAMCM